MNVDRNVYQCGLEEALHRIEFCLNHIEKIDGSCVDLFSQRIWERLTMEEIIGALVSAELQLKEVRDEQLRFEEEMV